MRPARPLVVLAVALAAAALARAQKIESIDRERARQMLSNIAADIRRYYYDPDLRGFDFDARVREADARIQKAADLGQALAIVAWAIDGLDDSHTYFIPPPRTFRHDYGWRMQMVGEHCYVTHVRPKSDAEAKGLTPGDEILSVNGLAPTRGIFFIMKRVFDLLRPQPEVRLQVRGVGGQERQLDVMAKVRPLKRGVDLSAASGFDIWNFVRELEEADRLVHTRCIEMGEDLAICKMPQFNLEESKVRDLLGHARKQKRLILDLRGNPGGSVDTLERMVGGFLDHEVKIGGRVGRKTMKPLVAKSLGHHVFSGKLVVLLDSSSASAAELFARVMQLEKRGAVLGDRSAGHVMEGKVYNYRMGAQPVVFYGAVITDADIIMADGKSLERVGVIPDEIILPSAADLAGGADPVIARAAQLLGVKLGPEQAGKLFPYEWPSQ